MLPSYSLLILLILFIAHRFVELADDVAFVVIVTLHWSGTCYHGYNHVALRRGCDKLYIWCVVTWNSLMNLLNVLKMSNVIFEYFLL